MRLISKNLNGNVHTSIDWINKFNLGGIFHSVIPVSPQASIIILKFDTYEKYCIYCHKTNQEPMAYDLFFNRVGELVNTPE